MYIAILNGTTGSHWMRKGMKCMISTESASAKHKGGLMAELILFTFSLIVVVVVSFKIGYDRGKKSGFDPYLLKDKIRECLCNSEKHITVGGGYLNGKISAFDDVLSVIDGMILINKPKKTGGGDD
jgi:hypothetical protein